MQILTSAIVACGNTLVREATGLLKPLKTTVPQFDVLELLHRAPGGMRPSELAASLVFDPSNATYLIDQLERRNWLVRKDEPGDRRAYRVFLTSEGKLQHRRAAKVYRAALRQLREHLGEQEAKAITEAVNRVTAAAPVVAARVASP